MSDCVPTSDDNMVSMRLTAYSCLGDQMREFRARVDAELAREIIPVLEERGHLAQRDRELKAEALEEAARIVADVARQGGGLQTAEQVLIREAARLHATNLNGDAS